MKDHGCDAHDRVPEFVWIPCGTLQHWYFMKKALALSSAEAEVYAFSRSAAAALVVQSLAPTFGVSGILHIDAPAAVGITRRRGA